MEEPRNYRINKGRWSIDQQRLHLNNKQFPKRDVKKIDEILSSIIDSLSQPKQDSIIILEKDWVNLVGEQIAQFSLPGFIKNNYLNILVSHSGWINELEKIKNILINRINGDYDFMSIKGINFILKDT